MDYVSFKIQIPTEVIKNPNITHESFLVYGKLIQHYYIKKGESYSILIDHKKFMYFSNIKANQTFKKCILQLHDHGLIENKIDKLPRGGTIEVKLSSRYVNSQKDFSFAQLPYYILDKCIVDSIGMEGVRLLYYFKSYINNSMQFCFSSRETIAAEIGSNPKTVDKYTNLLKENKFIKVEKHMLKSDGEYADEFGNEKEMFIKFNNHYYIRTEKLDEIHKKLKNNADK